MFGAKSFSNRNDDYRDPRQFERLARKIAASMTRPWTIMEVCGDQARVMLEYNLFELLPKELTIAHGPGCPVASVPVQIFDSAIAIARDPNVIFCASAELLRIPGSSCDLLEIKACGADVRVVYSAVDCINIGRTNPDKKVVFFSVGFENAAQMDALAVWQARRLGVDNFYLLSYHSQVPAVCSAVLGRENNVVNGLLGPGQICGITGFDEYDKLSRQHNLPVVITGFEPVDILEGIQKCVSMLESGKIGVENQYKRAIDKSGNPEAMALINEVFERGERQWRGIGTVENGGYSLKPNFQKHDALRVFAPTYCQVDEESGCISHLIWAGLRKPTDCPAFGKGCKPDSPLGASMVSSEGTCAAYYKYRKDQH
jgi:hydrogenase expression/formation protein HypD